MESLQAAGAHLLLANTYHLLLRPGAEVFRRFGGIHRFMSWHGPVLTDSGGYQIFSLPHSRAMTEEGADFQSYVDGKRILLSPGAQHRDADGDRQRHHDGARRVRPLHRGRASRRAAMERTHRWALRSLAGARRHPGRRCSPSCRAAAIPTCGASSAAFLRELPFDGFAIGGLAVGETPRASATI